MHLGELDDKPREYFGKTKWKVTRKYALAKWVYQHKMHNVDTSDDERKIDQEYQKLKKKQGQVSSICERRIREIREQDYLSIKASRSISDLSIEGEIKVQHVKPIGGNTLPPQYSREISRYQPSDKEGARAMKYALSAVRQFTSDSNLSKNGNLNTTTMREMWDYENQEPSLSKTKDASEVIPERPKNVQSILNVNYVVETMRLINAPMKIGLVD